MTRVSHIGVIRSRHSMWLHGILRYVLSICEWNAEPPSPRLVAEISFIKQVFHMKFLQVAPTLPPFLSVQIDTIRAHRATETLGELSLSP